MKLALFQNTAPFEILEQRLALSFDATHEAYYPEGFANSAITESVSITNSGTAPVQYELWARYETGQRDQLLRSGVVAPGAWDDVSISDPENPTGILVRPNAPFTLVLKSDGELSASLRHDDAGAAAGASFSRRGPTKDLSIVGIRSTASARDFLFVYETVQRLASATSTHPEQAHNITPATRAAAAE